MSDDYLDDLDFECNHFDCGLTEADARIIDCDGVWFCEKHARYWKRVVAVRDRSRELEQTTGLDSFDTIATKYERTEAGAIRCPFPGCKMARREALAIFKHVHFGPHGRSYRVNFSEFVAGGCGE